MWQCDISMYKLFLYFFTYDCFKKKSWEKKNIINNNGKRIIAL